ncbi:Bro-N domain-containing protein [Castellaniella hirudinis]|uniref:BRO-N domain-containing protein n=1 Tax=Castellaniella hirudinis TaxID=1144617 RepID=UPI0039C4B870
MSAIMPFAFENHNVRIRLDDAGNPWFVAADVCAALELPETHKAVARLDEDEKDRNSIPTPGGSQDMTVINEPGLYSLVLGSRKAAAKRFKRWITHDVLPAIRQTGHYAAPGSFAALPTPTQDQVQALLLVGEAVAKVPGVKQGIAMAATLTCISENTGLTVETLRRALPANDEPICALNATQLGKLIGKSAKATNQLLAANDLQFRNDRDEWELTDYGQEWAEAMPYSRNGHSGYQILWNPAVAGLFVEVA